MSRQIAIGARKRFTCFAQSQPRVGPKCRVGAEIRLSVYEGYGPAEFTSVAIPIKLKKVKGSAGDQTFTVEKISRDCGPCKLNSGPSANAHNAR